MKRLVIAILGAASLGLATVPPAQAQSKQLLLFNWTNYIPPALLKRFEAETGIVVTLDTYDSNDTLLAKLEAGGGGYDLAVPSASTLKLMIDEKRVIPFDAQSLPNFKNLQAAFRDSTFDPGRKYSVPYMWGTTSFAYDSKKVKAGPLDESWKELFEPRDELRGQLAMLTEAAAVYNAAAYYLKIDKCTENGAEAQKILDLLLAQKPFVKLYSTSGAIDRMSTGEVAMHMSFNGAMYRARLRNPTVVYVYPREGLDAWIDSFVIPVGAKNVENAKTFMNWMLDPKNAAEASNFTAFNNAVAGSEQHMNAALKADPAIVTPAEYLPRLRETKVCTKAALDLRAGVWTRLMR